MLWACGWNPIWCNHLNETSPAVLLHGTIWFVRQVVLKLWACRRNPVWLWCYHGNETSPAILLHGTIWFVCHGSKLLAFGWILLCDHSNETSLSSTFTWCYFLQNVALTFESVDEILLCHYSKNKTSLDPTEISLVVSSDSHFWNWLFGKILWRDHAKPLDCFPVLIDIEPL